MIYIVVLNWNNAKDTLCCVKSLMALAEVDFKIIVVDNFSTDNSYDCLKNELPKYVEKGGYIKIHEDEADSFSFNDKHKICFIQTSCNLGYAGGNNIGMKLALNQEETKYIWVVNNDTEFDKFALKKLVDKLNSNNRIGVCGSRLINYEDRKFQQSLGGVYYKYLCTTKQFEYGVAISKRYDDDIISEKIDYVVGAAMFFTRECLNEVGLLTPDYFLYYEEIDFCLRAKKCGYKLGICSESYVYHKEGASTNGGKSNIADYCSIKNRLKFTQKFYPQYYLFVWLSLFGVAFNRLKRKEFGKMIVCIKLILTFGISKYKYE